MQANGDVLNLKISKETFEEFKERITKRMHSIPVEVINKTIESTPKRLKSITDNNWCRSKSCEFCILNAYTSLYYI